MKMVGDLEAELKQLRDENEKFERVENLKAAIQKEKEKKKGRSLKAKFWKGIKKELRGLV